MSKERNIEKELDNRIGFAQYQKRVINRLIEKGELNLAEEKVNIYRKNFPDDIDGYTMSSTLYYCKGELDKAEKEIEGIIHRFPFSYDLNYNLAAITLARGSYKKSLKYYYRSYQISENEKEKSDLMKNIKAIEGQGIIEEKIIADIERKEREIFEHSYRFFPIGIEGKTYVGDMILKDENNEGNYVAIYDYYTSERDGIHLDCVKGLEQFYKTEILNSIYTNDIELEFKEKHILPVCINNDDNKVKLNTGGNSYDLSKNIPNRFYYYPMNAGKLKIKSKDNIVLGKPIKLHKNPNKRSLVLNIFVDGLSQKVIESHNLESLMPNTHRYFSKGTVCNNVYVTGEWTYVNLASFFTGEYITNHGMFHPSYNTTLNKDKQILGELFKNDGYFTSKIDGDWRSVPTYGYGRGIDRFVYQASVRGMNLEEVITETIEHIEAFKDTNKFLWTCINELHDVADGYEGRLMTQINDSLDSRLGGSKADTTSVRTVFDENKIDKYITQIKRLDVYLGLLFNYLEENYSDEEVLVSLISDHGQGYLVPEDKAFLSEERTKVPFMFRGKNIPTGKCEELIEGVDLLPILLKSSDIQDEDMDNRDANLPKYFGGAKERDFTYTESIFPRSTYKATINDKKHEFIFETEGLVEVDGRFELGNYKYNLRNKNEGNIETNRYGEKIDNYLEVILNHIKDYIIY